MSKATINKSNTPISAKPALGSESAGALDDEDIDEACALPELIDRIFEETGGRAFSVFSQDRLATIGKAMKHAGLGCDVLVRVVEFYNHEKEHHMTQTCAVYGLQVDGRVFDANGVAGWDNILNACKTTNQVGYQAYRWESGPAVDDRPWGIPGHAQRIIDDLVRADAQKRVLTEETQAMGVLATKKQKIL